MEDKKAKAATLAAKATSRPKLAMVALLDEVPAAIDLINAASDMRSVGLVVEAALAEISAKKATKAELDEITRAEEENKKMSAVGGAMQQVAADPDTE